MTNKITPETATAFVKVLLSFSFSWPLPKNASRFQVIRIIIIRFLLSLNAVLLIVFTTYTLYRNDSPIAKLAKVFTMFVAFLQALLQIMQCALQYNRLQYVALEFEDNLRHAEAHEKKIYKKIYGQVRTILRELYIGGYFNCGRNDNYRAAYNGNQTFPTDIKYPFSVKHVPVKILIFLHQTIGIWQCVSTLCYCNIIGLFLFFCTARFEILSQQFRAFNNIRDIIVCIIQHNKLLRYTQDVIIAIRTFVLTIIFISFSAMISSNLAIVFPSTLADKGQFVGSWIIALTEIFACAWPADYLIEASSNIAQAVYESPWYKKNLVLQRNILFVFMKSQVPVTFSASSMLPALSLNYLASYVSTSFSYFMTVRLILERDTSANIK